MFYSYGMSYQNGICHHGVPGMKWGVRNDKFQSTTKNGDVITINKRPTPKLAQFISKYSKTAKDNVERSLFFDIKDSSGSKVGDVQLYKESDDSVNIVWLGTKNKERGKGYASAVMKTTIDIAKESGAKHITLEVPGNSPDARHIYEKMGFKEVPTKNIDTDDIWGGLTNMRLDIDDIKHSDNNDLVFDDDIAKKYLDRLTEEIDDLYSDEDDVLYQYGVPGMKWGVRRNSKTKSVPKRKTKKEIKAEKKAQKLEAEKRKKNPGKNMSDQELKDQINRLQMERQYKQLIKDLEPEDIKRGDKIVKSSLAVIGTTAATTASVVKIYKNVNDIKKMLD